MKHFKTFKNFVNKSVNEGVHPKIKKAMKAVEKGETVYGENIRFPGRFKIISFNKLGSMATVDYEDGTEPMEMAAMNIAIDKMKFESVVNEYGPMRGSRNRNYSTNDLVDRIGELDDILMYNRKTEREWEEMSQNYLDGERGSEYWADLGNQELQDAIDDAESLMKKYGIKESVVNEAKEITKNIKDVEDGDVVILGRNKHFKVDYIDPWSAGGRILVGKDVKTGKKAKLKIKFLTARGTTGLADDTMVTVLESITEGYHTFNGEMAMDLEDRGTKLKRGDKVTLEIQPNYYVIYGPNRKQISLNKIDFDPETLQQYVIYESVNEAKMPVNKENIEHYIGAYGVDDDPYDVAVEIGGQYGWTQRDIEKAEKLIRKHYIR